MTVRGIGIVSGASVPSPTFTGTVTFPDGSTWTSTGLNDISKAIFTLNSGATPSSLSGTVIQIVGANAADTGLEFYGFGAGIPRINVRTAAGTSTAPSGPLNAATLFSIGGRPYGATGYAAANRWAINLSATENQTDTQQGNQLQIRLTPTGGISTATVFTMDGSGNLVLAGSMTSQGVVVASGTTLKLGNAATTGLTAGVLAALTNATVVLLDSTGQAYRIPCII